MNNRHLQLDLQGLGPWGLHGLGFPMSAQTNLLKAALWLLGDCSSICAGFVHLVDLHAEPHNPDHTFLNKPK